MFQEYFNKIQQLFLSDSESSEHTYRSALETLLIEFKSENINRDLIVKHEPIKQGDLGRPDYKITTSEQLTIGLIETKKIGENLKNILKTKQLEKYKQLSDNIIITDYLNFVLIKKGEPILDVPLFSEFNLQNKRFKLEPNRIDELSRLLTQFFESEPETITKTHDLALKLAEKARFLKKYSFNELSREEDRNELLFALLQAFKDTLLPSLDEKYFSDIYAQTITYSLFLSALNCDDPKNELNRNTAYSMLPKTFPLIKELFHSIDDFPREIIWSIDEIITILKVTDFVAIKKEFAEYRNKEQGFSDPFIYFYEDFLYHYDPKQRKIRGVYYTPEAVVSFIVRSIDIILKDTFGLKDGFINKDVTLLDFAAGTGTFLLSAISKAIEQAQQVADKNTVNKILNEQILKNFYGFEFLVAPYVISHLKISEYLKDQGFSIEENNRLNILLTNTLTNKEPQPFGFLPHLSEEGRKANEVKNKPIFVILGNPPYSVSSSNKTGFIAEEKMGLYKDAVKNERNIQPLSDDYIKFIRFAHWKMENIENGVVGIITNNSFIDGVIHRGMREELMKEFDDIYILNLHGSSRINETAPDGSKDENVFEIMQGVSISFFVKSSSKKSKKMATVYYADLFGKKDFKYQTLLNNDIESLKKNNDFKWMKTKPSKEYYFFSNKNFDLSKKYNQGWKITDIFNLYSSGITTAADDKFYHIKNTFKKNNQTCLYKPFDIRNIHYDHNELDRSRINIMKHFIDNYNIGLCLRKTVENQAGWKHIFISNTLTDGNLLSARSYVFPLYYYNGDEIKNSGYVQEPSLNYGDTVKKRKPNFKKEFSDFIRFKYKSELTPEQIIGYIYAILHSPTYRANYIEFLKIDFPKVPFVDDEKLFKKLAAIGFDLIEHHLMKKSFANNICKMEGISDNYSIEKIDYKCDKQELWVNKDRYFAPIPQEIWEYYSGGYQVLDKWLKERKKHDISLSGTDILHFINMVNIIDHTIKTMQKIDELTIDWI